MHTRTTHVTLLSRRPCSGGVFRRRVKSTHRSPHPAIGTRRSCLCEKRKKRRREACRLTQVGAHIREKKSKRSSGISSRRRSSPSSMRCSLKRRWQRLWEMQRQRRLLCHLWPTRRMNRWHHPGHKACLIRVYWIIARVRAKRVTRAFYCGPKFLTSRLVALPQCADCSQLSARINDSLDNDQCRE